jgi:hypothetical protein
MSDLRCEATVDGEMVHTTIESFIKVDKDALTERQINILRALHPGETYMSGGDEYGTVAWTIRVPAQRL